MFNLNKVKGPGGSIELLSLETLVIQVTHLHRHPFSFPSIVSSLKRKTDLGVLLHFKATFQTSILYMTYDVTLVNLKLGEY